jgi:hypothetical protein
MHGPAEIESALTVTDCMREVRISRTVKRTAQIYIATTTVAEHGDGWSAGPTLSG